MKIEYDKKDIAESPKTKSVKKTKKPDFPEGWQYYVKRGTHCTLDSNGNQVKHTSKEAAMEYANGYK
jgi:hypothetical protein